MPAAQKQADRKEINQSTICQHTQNKHIEKKKIEHLSAQATKIANNSWKHKIVSAYKICQNTNQVTKVYTKGVYYVNNWCTYVSGKGFG